MKTVWKYDVVKMPDGNLGWDCGEGTVPDEVYAQFDFSKPNRMDFHPNRTLFIFDNERDYNLFCSAVHFGHHMKDELQAMSEQDFETYLERIKNEQK